MIQLTQSSLLRLRKRLRLVHHFISRSLTHFAENHSQSGLNVYKIHLCIFFIKFQVQNRYTISSISRNPARAQLAEISQYSWCRLQASPHIQPFNSIRRFCLFNSNVYHEYQLLLVESVFILL